MTLTERTKLLDTAELLRREGFKDLARQVQNVAMRNDPGDNG
jgi:hypothetical protein